MELPCKLTRCRPSQWHTIPDGHHDDGGGDGSDDDHNECDPIVTSDRIDDMRRGQ